VLLSRALCFKVTSHIIKAKENIATDSIRSEEYPFLTGDDIDDELEDILRVLNQVTRERRATALADHQELKITRQQNHTLSVKVSLLEAGERQMQQVPHPSHFFPRLSFGPRLTHP